MMSYPARKIYKKAVAVKTKSQLQTTLGDLIAAVADEAGNDEDRLVALTVVDLLSRKVKTRRPIQVIFSDSAEVSAYYG